jgi:hypothetical protein
MELPWKFPDHREETRKRCQAFQRLSSDERIRLMLDTIESGLAMIRSSPHREAIDRVHAERRREWREIQRELFKRHGG